MIQVAIGEQHGVDFLLGRDRWAIERLGFPTALEESAIHENVGLLRLYKIGRPGDFTSCGAKNSDSHFFENFFFRIRPDAEAGSLAFNFPRMGAGRLLKIRSTASLGESVT